MPEHMLACFVVHLSFEAVPLLQRGSGLSGRASADLIKETLEVREVPQAFSPRMNGTMRAQPHRAMSTMV